VLSERWGHDSRAKAQYIRKALQAHGELEPSKLIKVNGKPVRYTTLITATTAESARQNITWSQVVSKTESAMQRELEQNGSF
jgi:hypothetical protein